jgi:hypothetical protein
VSALRVSVPSERLAGSTLLYRDFALRPDAPVHRRVGGFRGDAEAWRRGLTPVRGVDARLVERMVADNTALGASRETLDRLRGLASGQTRAVVTGQQPGVAGGPLLALYKAATAAALAREIEARWRTPCVAIFWLGADDDDFEEIRELAIVGDTLSVISASLDATAHAPGRRVGDIAGAAVARVWDAVVPFLPKGDGAREVAAHVGAAVRGGDDLGRIAARALVGLTEGSVAVVDGREALLREASRETLMSFFDREDGLRSLVREGGEALVADGYHAQLDTGTDSGLFLVREGTRRRIPPEARDTARAEFARDITTASPGVVARNLVQDAVFAPAAVVLGPAEIAYRAQLARVYDVLGVEKPVVFPRLAATFVPPAVGGAADEYGVDAALLATDPPAWVTGVVQALESVHTASAARTFEEAFRSEAARFVAAASERLDARAREKLERRVAELASRVATTARGAVEQDSLAAASKWPWLARAAELFARDGEPQERFLSALVPYTFHGRDAWNLVGSVAADHVRDALDGRVLHRVYSR